MIQKIISLTKVFSQEFYKNLPIFNDQSKRINKKSIFFWLIAIIFLGVSYVSFEAIDFFRDIGQANIFINLYFFALLIILAFQTIIVSTNLYFFSNDIENILHMPLKPVELLIAKLNTLLIMLYFTELIMGVVPLALYGAMTEAHILYYLWSIIILIIFPIFIALCISIFTLLIMRIGRFIKNKEAFQVITVLILMLFMFGVEYIISQGMLNIDDELPIKEQTINLTQRAQQINKYFLILNPSAKVLLQPASFEAIKSLLQIILYNGIALITLIIIGKITYLKDILNNMISSTKIKKRNINKEKDIKIKSISKSYITKEIKNLVREPIFFMQCVLPAIIVLVTIVILGVIILPTIQVMMQDETLKNEIDKLTFGTEIIAIILIVMQVLFSLSSISLTAISREGKNAIIIKYIPIELYKQFLYKCFPQIVLNMLITIIILGVIGYIIPTIKIIYLICIFIISTLINLINSYLMLIIDLRRPNLDWDSTYSVVKKSDNKLFQYVFMIINILVLMYISKLLEGLNINIAIIIETIIYLIIFIIIDRCVKKFQEKLFNKIS